MQSIQSVSGADCQYETRPEFPDRALLPAELHSAEEVCTMRFVLIVGAALGFLVASEGVASAQTFRTGPEANKYLFMFYAIDDMTREFSLPEIEAIKKNSEPMVYAD